MNFAAMKASGIILATIYGVLIHFCSFTRFWLFYFANSVIPAAEQKMILIS